MVLLFLLCASASLWLFILSDSPCRRRYTSENDKRSGSAGAVCAGKIAGRLHRTGAAPCELGLFRRAAAGPLAATVRGSGAIRLLRPRPQCRQADEHRRLPVAGKWPQSLVA